MELSNSTHTLMSESVEASTRAAYKSGFDCFLHFLRLNNIVSDSSIPAISEEVLMSFVTFCHTVKQLAYSTIKLYLCGIRFNYVLSGVSSPLCNLDGAANPLIRLHMVLQGVKKQGKTTTRRRLPVTIDVLHNVCTRLQQGLRSPFLDAMLRTACITAFFAFLRCGEFTCKTAFDPSVNLCCQDISILPDHVVLHLKQSKSDPFRQGVDIKLYCLSSPLCPKCQITRYMRIRQQVFPSDGSDSCFVNAVGQPLTRVEFIALFRHALVAAGYDAALYSGHSFRIGAATTAARVRVEDHLIKVLGRWSSDAYTRYIHTSPSTLQSAQQSLANSTS